MTEARMWQSLLPVKTLKEQGADVIITTLHFYANDESIRKKLGSDFISQMDEYGFPCSCKINNFLL